MSDINSSLPVRTENAGDVIAKIADATTPSQQLAIDSSGRPTVNQGAPNTAANGWPVKPTDGTNSQSYTASGEAKVDLTSSYEDHNFGAVGANTLRTASQVGNATGAADFNYGAVSAQTLRSAAQVGNATGAADFNFGAASAQTLRVAALPGNAAGIADFNFGTVGAQTIRTAAEIGNATGAADFNYGTVTAQTVRSAAQVGNATGAADYNNGATGAQTLRVAANLAVAGANVTAANPVPVTIEDVPGTHINDYKDATSIAANASDNHDYTVTAGKTLHLQQLEASASGKAKMVVSVETGVATGVFNTVFVQFNSTATPNMSIHIDDDILVAAGVRVRVVMTNRDNQAEDLYSTICGFEV